MSTRTDRSIDWTKLLILGAVTVVVLGGVAYGVNYLWQKRFGPTQASAQDCRQAQQLFNLVATKQPPTGPATVDAWVSELRPQWLQLKDEGLATQGLAYSWMTARKATGGVPATKKEYQQMLDEANGHCKDSGVKLTIKPLL
jgi:hypothetical protein